MPIPQINYQENLYPYLVPCQSISLSKVDFNLKINIAVGSTKSIHSVVKRKAAFVRFLLGFDLVR